LTSPYGKTHNQINYILKYRRRHSNILDFRSFIAEDCDGSGKFRERLAVSKQTTNGFHMERLNLKKLNEVKSKE
jgi:hypothetical protein